MRFGKPAASNEAETIVADCALYAVEQWGAGDAGESLAAFIAAYVSVRGPDFGVPESAAPLLPGADWQALVATNPRFRFRSPAFVSKFSLAEELLRTSDKPNAAYFAAIEHIAAWEVDRDDCLNWMRATRDAAENMLRIKSLQWESGR